MSENDGHVFIIFDTSPLLTWKKRVSIRKVVRLLVIREKPLSVTEKTWKKFLHKNVAKKRNIGTYIFLIDYIIKIFTLSMGEIIKLYNVDK